MTQLTTGNTFMDINQEVVEKLLQAEMQYVEKGQVDEELQNELTQALSLQADKVDNIARFDLGLKARENALKEEAKRLKGLADNIGSARTRFGAYLKENLSLLQEPRVVGTHHEIKLRKNPPKLLVKEGAQVPAEFIEIVQTQKVKKVEIKKAIQAGREIEGFKVVQETGIMIK